MNGNTDYPPPPAHGGTRPRPYGLLRSPLLRFHGASLAEATFHRIEETWPDLALRYGNRGRQYTAEDNAWHLDFLDSSSSRQDPKIFTRYAEWLTRFLVARQMEPGHISGAFRIMAREIASLDVPAEWADHRGTLMNLLESAADHVDASWSAMRPSA